MRNGERAGAALAPALRTVAALQPEAEHDRKMALATKEVIGKSENLARNYVRRHNERSSVLELGHSNAKLCRRCSRKFVIFHFISFMFCFIFLFYFIFSFFFLLRLNYLIQRIASFLLAYYQCIFEQFFDLDKEPNLTGQKRLVASQML